MAADNRCFMLLDKCAAVAVLAIFWFGCYTVVKHELMQTITRSACTYVLLLLVVSLLLNIILLKHITKLIYIQLKASCAF